MSEDFSELVKTATKKYAGQNPDAYDNLVKSAYSSTKTAQPVLHVPKNLNFRERGFIVLLLCLFDLPSPLREVVSRVAPVFGPEPAAWRKASVYVSIYHEFTLPCP